MRLSWFLGRKGGRGVLVFEVGFVEMMVESVFLIGMVKRGVGKRMMDAG